MSLSKYFESLNFSKVILGLAVIPPGYGLFERAILETTGGHIQVVVNSPGTEYTCFLSSLFLSEKLLSLAEFLSCLWFPRTNVENMNLLCSHLPEQND